MQIARRTISVGPKAPLIGTVLVDCVLVVKPFTGYQLSVLRELQASPGVRQEPNFHHTVCELRGAAIKEVGIKCKDPSSPYWILGVPLRTFTSVLCRSNVVVNPIDVA